MALISKDQLSEWIATRRRSVPDDSLELQSEVEPETLARRHQLMLTSSLSSIIGPVIAAGVRPSRQPAGRLTGHVGATIDATVTGLSLHRDTGTVTGALTTDGSPLTYLPQFLRTVKGQAAVKSDGTITYTPWPGARRAAARAGAGFRGSDADTLTLTAVRPDGSAVRVQVRIMILGH